MIDNYKEKRERPEDAWKGKTSNQTYKEKMNHLRGMEYP